MTDRQKLNVSRQTVKQLEGIIDAQAERMLELQAEIARLKQQFADASKTLQNRKDDVFVGFVKSIAYMNEKVAEAIIERGLL